jgi:hypothetical protein
VACGPADAEATDLHLALMIDSPSGYRLFPSSDFHAVRTNWYAASVGQQEPTVWAAASIRGVPTTGTGTVISTVSVVKPALATHSRSVFRVKR